MEDPTALLNIDVARVFDLGVFQPHANGSAIRIVRLPEWWHDEIGTPANDEMTFVSPALLEFLELDAVPLWSATQDDLRLSPYMEFGEDRMSLQATAVRQNGQNVLLIRNLNIVDPWFPNTLRQARENLLTHARNQSEQQKQLIDITADRDEAIRLEQIKSEFLANMSHEIRTPLTTILGMAAMAQTEPQPEVQQKYLDGIVSAANRLLRLGNDVLDLSRIQANRLALDCVAFSIGELMTEFEVEWQLHASQRDVSFSVSVAEETPQVVVGDPFRLRQVLNNLVGNGMKFTEEGGVTLRVQPGDQRDFLLFEIEDTGVGISKHEQTRIFESFTQVDESNRRRHQGAGLGLAIASNLVRLMDGELQVRSVPRQGSLFFFEANLPAESDVLIDRPAEKHAEDTAAEEREQKLRVLVAEDHGLNRSLIVDMLSSADVIVFEAANGEEAVLTWKDHPIDVVLMDCQMPIMSGLDAIKVIRQSETENKRTPIVALTAHAMQDDRKRLLDSGADEYLAKPFDRDKLIDLVLSLGQKR